MSEQIKNNNSSNVETKNVKIKVAQVIGKGNNGGVESMIINLYKFIDRDKIQFDFFLENECVTINKENVKALGGNFYIIPSYKHPLRYMKVLTKLFKDNKYDIVHSNMNTLSFFTLRAAKKAGINLRIAHSHSTSNKKEKMRNLIKNILKHFSKIYSTDYLACGELAGKWLFGEKTYNNGKVLVVNNGVDYDRFKFNSLLRSEGRKFLDLNDEFVVGSVGRMVEQKNQLFLIDVFSLIHKKIPNSKFVLLGSGPLESELRKKVHSVSLDNNVIFILNTDKPELFYNSFDVFLLPSLYEGLPVSAIEAQVNGLTCLVSNTISEDVAISSKTKLLPIDDPDLWCDIVVRYFNNDDKIRKFPLNQTYDIKNSSKLLENKYLSMIEEQGAKK